jgi:hypothetical protein
VAALFGGGLVGLLIYKPQLGLLIPVAFGGAALARLRGCRRQTSTRSFQHRAHTITASDEGCGDRPTLNDRLDDLVRTGDRQRTASRHRVHQHAAAGTAHS